MRSKAIPTRPRVRRRLGTSPVFIHGFGVIEPGQFTEAIPLDEARRRADFEVIEEPFEPLPDPETPTPATSKEDEL